MTLPARSWARARREQLVQQRERPPGLALGEQHAGQHQVPGLLRVAGLIVRAEAVLLGKADGGLHVSPCASSSRASSDRPVPLLGEAPS